MSDFLPGFYSFLFLPLEPIFAIGPIILTLASGPSAFYNELISPASPPPQNMDLLVVIAICRLLSIGYCLCFLSLMLGYRAVRGSLHDNPVAQEKIVGALLIALAMTDIANVWITWINLGEDVKYMPYNWNTFCIILHVTRICGFLGVGRKRYQYGQPDIRLATGTQTLPEI